MQRLAHHAWLLAARQSAAAGPWPQAATAWRAGGGSGGGCAAPRGASRGFAISPDSGPETHDDFKPKYTGGPAADAAEQIKQDIAGHRVFIYMKGTPDAPQCGFSNMACRVLDAYGLKYGSRNVLADAGIREGVKKFTDWPTIPQVFVRGEFIGGSDVLMEMHNSGEMAKLVESLEGEGGAK